MDPIKRAELMRSLLKIESNNAPTTRRDRIVFAIVWFAVTLAGIAVGALVRGAF